MAVELVTLAERPGLAESFYAFEEGVWPRFILESERTTNQLWDRLLSDFAAFQLVLLDKDGALMATGNSIPFVWNRSESPTLSSIGFDDVFALGMQAWDQGERANALAFLALTIDKQFQSRGISQQLLEGMKQLALIHSLDFCVAPVRPSLKDRYPLTPMARYSRWERADGAPFDLWLRVHWRMGARFLSVAESSLTVTGTIPEWESWTEMAFPETGLYVVPGALAPVHMDVDQNIGRYIEPNVWMEHPL